MVEIFLVFSWQPFFGVGGNGGGVALGGEVIAGVDVFEFAGVDQAHEEVPHFDTVLRLIEEGVFAMKNCFFQRSLRNVIVPRGTRHAEE